MKSVKRTERGVSMTEMGLTIVLIGAVSIIAIRSLSGGVADGMCKPMSGLDNNRDESERVSWNVELGCCSFTEPGFGGSTVCYGN